MVGEVSGLVGLGKIDWSSSAVTWKVLAEQLTIGIRRYAHHQCIWLYVLHCLVYIIAVHLIPETFNLKKLMSDMLVKLGYELVN